MNGSFQRLAYVCADPGVPVFGSKGCSIHAQEVLREFVRRGIRVDLFASRRGGENPFPAEWVRCVEIPIRSVSGGRERELALVEADIVLKSMLHAAGPFDLVYERHSLWSTSGMRFAAETGIPGVLEVNAPLVEEQATHRGLVEVDVARAMALTSFESARSLIAVSEEVAAYLNRCCPRHGGVHVVANGVNPDRFAGGWGRDGSNGQGVTVGFVGTLKPWHGVEYLMEAFRILRRRIGSVRLLIVGDGPERYRLEAMMSHEMAEGACRFTGLVGPDQIPHWIGQMDIAVAPYPELNHFYFSPLKVYEYMAAKRAVVASSIGQLKTLIQHDVNGVLCQPGNVMELAGQLLRLAEDPDLRRGLGAQALATIQKEHTWTRVVDTILSTVANEGWERLKTNETIESTKSVAHV